jgi:hypothetical protein
VDLLTRGVRAERSPIARIGLVPPRFAYARWPPGQLVLIATALVLLCLSAGLIGALDIQHRRAALDEVLERGGLLTGAAMETYQSISDADATVAGAFLVGGVEPPQLRDRYRTNIAEASAALSAAASGSPSGDSATEITKLTTHLPVYTGLIETARTLNRQGLPQGASYLREASTLAHTIMLPSAQRLLEQENSRLAATQAEAEALDWVALGAGILALLALVAAQIHLGRSTRRIFNAGLLIATVCAIAAVSWLIVVSTSATEHSTAGRRDGTAQIEVFTAARVAALQARGDESLTLVARGNGRVYEDSFTETARRLNGADGLLAAVASAATSPETRSAVAQAAETWQQWQASHRTLRAEDDSGNYNTAVRLATSTVDPNGTTGPSTMVDNQLETAIQLATKRFESESVQARSALSRGDLVVGLLTGVAALAIGFGYAPRLREFR